jgi:uncharacterized membrane protein
LKFIKIEWDDNIGPILLLNIKNRNFGFCFCHRIKDRSIWFFGLEKVLCSRCLGILLGGIIGLILIIYQYRIDLVWSILLLIPLIFDGVTQALNYRQSNNYFRLITGFLFGIGFQFFLVTIIGFLKIAVIS